MTNTDPVVAALEKALADTYALALKTQNYHWNVRGPQFYGLHNMFEEQYTDMHNAVDDIAERIRALDSLAPGGFAAFQKLTDIKEGDGSASAPDMVKDLEADHRKVSGSLADGISTADDKGDDVTADMLTARKQVHDEAAWMLKSFNAG